MNRLRCFEVGRLKLREMVITFEVLSFCRNQGRDHVCGEKGVGTICGGTMCELRRSKRRMMREAKWYSVRRRSVLPREVAELSYELFG